MKLSERMFLSSLIVIAPQMKFEQATVLWTFCMVAAVFVSFFMDEATK